MSYLLTSSAVQASDKEKASKTAASPSSAGQGLLLISDIGVEHFSNMTQFQQCPKEQLCFNIGFQIVAALRCPLVLYCVGS